MNPCSRVSICGAVLAAFTLSAAAQSGPDIRNTGPYLGASFGAAFGNREIDDPQSRNDEGLGRSSRIFGGYQFNETFGVEAGYVRLRNLNRNTGSDATLVRQTVDGRSTYVAGTGRWVLNPSFALTGKLGVSFGKVSDASPANAATAALRGSKTSPLLGTGVEYRLSPAMALSLELDSYGKISSQVKGSALSFGARYAF